MLFSKAQPLFPGKPPPPHGIMDWPREELASSGSYQVPVLGDVAVKDSNRQKGHRTAGRKGAADEPSSSRGRPIEDGGGSRLPCGGGGRRQAGGHGSLRGGRTVRQQGVDDGTWRRD